MPPPSLFSEMNCVELVSSFLKCLVEFTSEISGYRFCVWGGSAINY